MIYKDESISNPLGSSDALSFIRQPAHAAPCSSCRIGGLRNKMQYTFPSFCRIIEKEIVKEKIS